MMNTKNLLLFLILSSTSTSLLQASTPAPAVWSCDTCTFRNKSSVGKCEVCDTLKLTARKTTFHDDEADAVAMVAATFGAEAVTAPTTRQAWQCPNCSTIHWAAETACNFCNTKRPAIAKAPHRELEDAAIAACLHHEETLRYKRQEADRKAARERERQAGELAAKRAANEAATQATIAKIRAENEFDAHSRRAAEALAAEYAAEERAERLRNTRADEAVARALAEAERAREAEDDVASLLLAMQLAEEDEPALREPVMKAMQEEADRLLAIRFEAEEVATAARLTQAATRAAAEIGAARRRGDDATDRTIRATRPPKRLPAATACPPAPLLPNRTGICFMNAMLHCLFSTSRLIDPIRALGSRCPTTTALNNVLNAYCANSVPEASLLALHEEILRLLPADHPRSGGDSAHTYQVLIDQLHTLNPSISNQVIHLGLPDATATPTSLEELITYYGVYLKQLEDARTKMIVNDKELLPIDVNSSVLAFNIARALPGNTINQKPVTLPETLTLHGVAFKLTACACHVPDHAYAQKCCAGNWFACDDDRYVRGIDKATVMTNNTQAYLVIYERI